MKAKILAALKNKYKKLGFSDKAINAVLAHLEKSVTAEDQIDEAVDGVEDLLTAFQAEVDSRVTTAVTTAVEKAKKVADPKAADPKTEGGDPAKPGEPAKPAEEVPAWAKSLAESIQSLSTKVSTLEAGNTSKTRLQTLEEKLKDANPTLKAKIIKDFGRMNFESDEDFNTYVEETVADLGEFNQAEADGGLKNQPKPSRGGGPSNKTASKEEVDAVVANIM